MSLEFDIEFFFVVLLFFIMHLKRFIYLEDGQLKFYDLECILKNIFEIEDLTKEQNEAAKKVVSICFKAPYEISFG